MPKIGTTLLSSIKFDFFLWFCEIWRFKLALIHIENGIYCDFRHLVGLIFNCFFPNLFLSNSTSKLTKKVIVDIYCGNCKQTLHLLYDTRSPTANAWVGSVQAVRELRGVSALHCFSTQWTNYAAAGCRRAEAPSTGARSCLHGTACS